MKLLAFLLGVITILLLAAIALMGYKIYSDDKKNATMLSVLQEQNKNQLTALQTQNEILQESNEINNRYTSWVFSK